MKIHHKIFQFKNQEEIIDIKCSYLNKIHFYAITKNGFFLKLDLNTERIIFQIKIPNSTIDWEELVRFHLSPDDKYAAIVNQYGQYGCVYDIENRKGVFHLNRNNYHVEQSIFPIAFFQQKNQTYLIHGSDWNHLDITNLTSQNTVSKRTNNKHGGEFYLDYFYGEIHLSPNCQYLASSGWLWGPGSLIKFIHLENWLSSNKKEPEIKNASDILIRSYYWDRAMCWINNNTIAFLYSPKEEDLDAKECQELEIQLDQDYIMIYDFQKNEIIQRIEFDGFLKNEYHEATPDCKLFFANNLYVSSKEKGVFVIDINTFKKIHNDPKTVLENHHQGFNLFYTLTKENTIDIVRIMGGDDYSKF